MESIIRNIQEIDQADREALEHVIGQRLREGQQVIIDVVDAVATPSEGPQTTGDLAGFADILHQIGVLATGDVADDYGVLQPTKFALSRTMDVLSRALKANMESAVNRKGRCIFPRGSPTTDEKGGLRIEWSAADRAVHLVIPAEHGGREYIYYECGNDYGTIDRVSGSLLARWLRRLFG